MMTNEIQLAVKSLGAAMTIVKGLIGLKVDTAVNEKAIELQGIILDMQSQLFSIQQEQQSLSDSKTQLEKQLMEIEDWRVIESRYSLERLDSGYFLRLPNANHPTGKPLHFLCANCFENKKKTYLQPHDGTINFFCITCKTMLRAEYSDHERWNKARGA